MEEKVKHYQEIFGLQNWRIDIHLESALNAKAKTLADPRYLHAEIYFQEKNPSEWTLVHEFIHISMALYDFYMDNYLPMEKHGEAEVARENSVSTLTNIMMRILK